MASEDEEFTMLFQDFYPSLCRFLECLLGGRAPLAQDLAQESFLQLHRTAWGTLPVGEARFWLYRVARNMAINEQLSYREIGQVLNISESKVKVDIFRARAALRERWSKRVKTVGASAS